MTLIAAVTVQGIPCLIGDIVLSLETDEMIPITLPTAGSDTFVTGRDQDWKICGTRQKIALISDDLVVAWAGRLSIAEKMVEQLRNLASTSNSLAVDFELYAHTFAQSEDREELSFIGWLHDGERMVRFGHGITKLRSEYLDEPWIAGEGDELFAVFANKISRFHGEFIPGTLPAANAVHICNSIVDELILAEFERDAALPDYFGGAYEICVWWDERFIKINSKNILISEIEMLAAGYRARERFYLRMDYVGDLLRLYVANSKLAEYNSWVQFVAPVGASKAPLENEANFAYIDPPEDLNCEWMSNLIQVRFPELPPVTMDAANTTHIDSVPPPPRIVGNFADFHVEYPEWLIRELRGRLSNQAARFFLGHPPSGTTGFTAPRFRRAADT